MATKIAAVLNADPEFNSGAVAAVMTVSNVNPGSRNPATMNTSGFTFVQTIEGRLGDGCIRTRFKYADGAAGTSRRVIAWEEDITGWPGYESVQNGADNNFNALL